jgi:Uncharacterised protein conserved in bacteria (DUF2336)
MTIQVPETENRAGAARPPSAPISPVTRAARVGEMVIRETLTPLLLLDLIAHADVSLVERGLSAITGFDERTIQTLLYDRGWVGLRTIFRAAGFDLSHLPAINTALDVLNEAGGSVVRNDRNRHAERCLSRFLTGSAEHLPPDTLDEVLGLLIDIGVTRTKPADCIQG